MKKLKKVKVPPISPERQAIFDQHNLNESDRDKLHRELYEAPLEKIQALAWRQRLPWVDLKVTGNELIKWYAASVKKRQVDAIKLAWARNKWFDYFHYVFQRPLRDYWEGNILGLDVVKLDEIMQPSDGVSTRDAILAKYDPAAVQMVEELIHGIEAPTEPYAAPGEEYVTA